ncbi:monovalent cation/H+ antiporter complex subunit F [Ornithinimicrobium sp. Y1694]|uniref:monovalent cation/H+ antiporter complex subunit F n=1 Tax=Ornithinimicrobium sp. Y1694 TaxID=3418590 RepID=UPI003CF71009
MELQTVETIFAWAVGSLMSLSALLVLIRITIGPSVLDRVVATDTLVSIVVCALGAYVALSGAKTTLPVLISLSFVGFLGSVAVARFVAADRDSPFVAPAPDRLEDQPDPRSEAATGASTPGTSTPATGTPATSTDGEARR